MDYAEYILDVWHPDIVTIIANSLPPNVVACSLRLVNKETSQLFKWCTRVNLSQVVPQHAFAWYLNSGDALRKLNRGQRLQLLSATAASGSLPNLKLLLRTTIRYLTGEDVDADEVPGDQLWGALEQYGRHDSISPIFCSTVSSGRGEACRWLMARGRSPHIREAALAAARAGHLGLMEELWGARGLQAHDLVAAAAEGCSLPDLTRLYKQELQDRKWFLTHGDVLRIFEAAATSPTADWKAKVIWLEAKRSRQALLTLMPWVVETVARSGLADSAERLAWLRDRGYPLGDTALRYAARAGNIPALTYLLDTLGAPSASSTTTAAAEGGHLTALQLLHARRCRINVRDVLRVAMRGGHVAVVSWLVKTFRISEDQLPKLTLDAVRSCSLPLLRWLQERGWFKAQEELVGEALEAHCSEEMLEWLVERGCPIPVDATPESLTALRCLQRLGWHPTEEVLNGFLKRTIRAPLRGPTLHWLRDQGALPSVTTETFLEWSRRAARCFRSEEED